MVVRATARILPAPPPELREAVLDRGGKGQCHRREQRRMFFDDLDAVIGALSAAGLEVTRMGFPAHALGGEAKVLDPQRAG